MWRGNLGETKKNEQQYEGFEDFSICDWIAHRNRKILFLGSLNLCCTFWKYRQMYDVNFDSNFHVRPT